MNWSHISLNSCSIQSDLAVTWHIDESSRVSSERQSTILLSAIIIADKQVLYMMYLFAWWLWSHSKYSITSTARPIIVEAWPYWKRKLVFKVLNSTHQVNQKKAVISFLFSIFRSMYLLLSIFVYCNSAFRLSTTRLLLTFRRCTFSWDRRISQSFCELISINFAQSFSLFRLSEALDFSLITRLTVRTFSKLNVVMSQKICFVWCLYTDLRLSITFIFSEILHQCYC